MKVDLAVALVSILGIAEAATPKIVTHVSSMGIGTSTYHDTSGKANGLGNWTDGCKGTSYDWIKQVCIDLPRKRAHIIYPNGTKRCFRQSSSKTSPCGTGVTCTTTTLTESGCNWRFADPEIDDDVDNNII
ncbi:hypothetical protein FVEN_g11718 [Fusarium venenatum]|uniref:Uncharacterized protein n=1 Tax=Fusarium venenatum TaxID=56646 RepID=A0A2L2SMM0_9HYPO|nr:uncharacterized protein FVRRES_11157 [Fusarium venenatum]KAG8350095.1 hypothetical protein FVEN_g11718 [Fusarium venenatum]KAH6977882.1 hypothetical protein EDB82DRAFT_476637 [Fusarium venenatum]CEI38466.1 unnamed protein product [Fusarium venenatum]